MPGAGCVLRADTSPWLASANATDDASGTDTEGRHLHRAQSSCTSTRGSTREHRGEMPRLLANVVFQPVLQVGKRSAATVLSVGKYSPYLLRGSTWLLEWESAQLVRLSVFGLCINWWIIAGELRGNPRLTRLD